MTRALPDAGNLKFEILRRLPLCAAAVLVCYQLHWTWLRFVTSEATLRFVEWCGYAAERLSPHSIAWNGQRFEFGISCTFADVFCGALPLLWVRHRGLLRNGALVVAFAAGLFAFNLFRQGLADVAFAAGVPWRYADLTVGGLSYFAVWVFLVRTLERSFGTAPAVRTPQQSSANSPVTAATPSSVSP